MSNATGIPSAVSEPKRRSGLADFFIRLVKEKPLGTVGGIVILILILIATFADVLAPYPPSKVHMYDRLQGASAQYLLGTDQVGRDLLSRLIFGARLSLLVGLATTAISEVFSVLVGGTSGFFGGRYDITAQRIVDAWISFPSLLLLLTVMSVVGQGVPQVILVLGIGTGVGGSRVVRSAVIGIKENDYFLAAKAVGSRGPATLMRHVLPNVAHIITVSFSIRIGGIILSLAALSFLGFGLPADTPGLGRSAQP